MDRIPCRVSADLRAKQLKEDQYIPEEFDHWIEEHVRAVVPKELVNPTRELLLALYQIELADRSFGADKVKAYDSLIQPLKDFRDGCKEVFKNR